MRLIKANDTLERYEPASGETFTLEELRKAVNGYFELVHLPNNFVLVVNEDGLRLKLPFNLIASLMARKSIVGDALLCHIGRID